jgi:hypothetical protein
MASSAGILWISSFKAKKRSDDRRTHSKSRRGMMVAIAGKIPA